MKRSQVSPAAFVRHTLVLATVSVGATATVRAQLPTSDSAFHVAPGSVRDLDEERLRAATVPSPGWVRVYRIPAPPEMVVKYYRARLGASSGPLEGLDPFELHVLGGHLQQRHELHLRIASSAFPR